MRANSLKSRLRRLSPASQNRLRRLNRLRWLEKCRIVRHYGASFQAHPLRVARYVLLDPDVGDFIFELDNKDELFAFLARALDFDPIAIAGYLAKAQTDTALTRELAARTRWRIDMKRGSIWAHAWPGTRSCVR